MNDMEFTDTEKRAYMRRCLQLARLGMGRVAPNPMVGCVVVANGRIIGEGFHRQFGGPHAEVNALNSVRERNLIPGSTVFVSLEPCSHYGKTPPCALRLIEEKVGKVIVCNNDPNPKVAGRGLDMLRKAGIEVETGILEDEGLELNRRFFTFHTLHRPYITLKWAQSEDGFIDGTAEKPLRISSDLTKALVHRMRSEEMAILVGTRTAIKDNPKLHTSRWFGSNPVRIAIDRNLLIPSEYNLYDGTSPTIIYNSLRSDDIRCRIDFDGDVVCQILMDLYNRGIQSLIVEGGRYTLDRFIESGMYDAFQIEISCNRIGSGTPAPEVEIPANARVECFKDSKIYSFR